MPKSGWQRIGSHFVKTRSNVQILARTVPLLLLLGLPPIAGAGTQAVDIDNIDLSFLNHTPAGKYGHITAKGEQLYAGDTPVRFLGVNLVFNGNTPDRKDADMIARRLARLGVNMVRLHHLDTRASPWGLLREDRRTPDPAQLDRLDYLVHALKSAGIYIDMNLHVGRAYAGHEALAGNKFWKGVDNYNPDMIRQQKAYARTLLLHRNPYTGMTYVDDPAIAIVEINNENGLMHSWLNGLLDNSPPAYQAELGRLWQRWLKQQPATSTMQPQRLMATSREALLTRASQLRLQLHDRATGEQTSEGEDQTRISLLSAGTEAWHAQLNSPDIAVENDRPYELRITLRASRPVKARLSLMQNRSPWTPLWQDQVEISTTEQSIRKTIYPARSEAHARLTLTGLGLARNEITLSKLSLTPIPPESPVAQAEAGSMPALAGFSSSPWPVRKAWLDFLWQTEDSYWRDMHRFLQQDLKVKALIIGTQSGYSPPHIQDRFDLIDAHAYWQHPIFPGNAWDEKNWFIPNTPMAGVSSGGTIPELAYRRHSGKPFFISEYDHPNPNAYHAEGLPLIAAYGALQGWSGIIQYAFGLHKGNWQNEDWRQTFFDSHANPAKLAGLAAAALIFRRGDVSSAPAPRAVNPRLPLRETWLRGIQPRELLPSAIRFGAPRRQALSEYVSMGSLAESERQMPVKSANGELNWGQSASKSFEITTPKTKLQIFSEETRHTQKIISKHIINNNETQIKFPSISGQ